MLALEFGEANVTALQRRISWRQFRRWRRFNELHPIDSRDRVDAVVARAAVLIASCSGAKNLKPSDIDVAGFVPAGSDADTHAPASMTRHEVSEKPVRSRKRKQGLDPAIFEAFGISDGR